ncbi:hypothetical protein V494_04285, partial [Pseudogymnoascus sp. VKM F-4513 (FW-928)]
MPRKESSSNSGTKRPRASMPKVKTGCLTCKYELPNYTSALLLDASPSTPIAAASNVASIASPSLLSLQPTINLHVLQACLKEEAVWHTAVALGSVHAGICGATVREEFAVR